MVTVLAVLTLIGVLLISWHLRALEDKLSRIERLLINERAADDGGI